MPNNQKRALMIGAHPDDCEFMTAGTALWLAQKGHAVKFVSLTNGETGHFEKSREETARVRKAEMEAACQIAHVECQVFDIPSNAIEADIETRERVIRLIREYRPDMIFTHRTNDYHPDHRRTATLVQDSSYAVRVPHVCPDTPCLRYSPVIFYMYDHFTKPVPFNADIVVGIDGVMLSKVEMLHCHVSQIYEWDPWIEGYTAPESEKDRLEWLYRRMTKRDGKVADQFRQMLIDKYGSSGKDIMCAEAFEISEYSRRPDDGEIRELFDF